MPGKTLLIVDDEPHVRHMLDYKLVRAGFSVITATNGVDALRLAREHHPDLMITDLQMPGGDGLSLCVQLSEHPDTATIPVIMLTARGYKVPPSDLARTNIKILLPKPFSPRELLAQVQELLDASHQADAGSDAA
ncbi:MAG: response regulator [Phycisphaerales bacterium]